MDLKLGKFTHADAGQMNLYLNYAREHWTHPHENPPVGLILCSEKDTAVAHYALGNLANQVLAREYHLNLPGEAEVAARIETVRRLFLPLPVLRRRPFAGDRLLCSGGRGRLLERLSMIPTAEMLAGVPETHAVLLQFR